MRTPLKITAGLAVAGMLALTGCSGDAGAGGDETFKVAAFTAGYGTPAGKESLDELVEKGKEKGWDVTLYTSDFDYDKINTDMQSAITQGADVIVAGFPDPRQIAPLVNAAETSEIPIFSIDGGVEPNEDFVQDITFDQQQIADLGLDALDEAMGGLEGKDVMVIGHDPHVGIMTRSNIAVEELEAAGANLAGGEMKQVLNPGTSQEETLKFVTDYLQANPEGLDGIWTGWDHAALGAVQAIGESGQDEIYVTGVDALGAAAAEIEKDGPFYASVLQDWSTVVDMTVDSVEAYRADGTLPAEDFVEVEPELIDRSNVSDYEPTM